MSRNAITDYFDRRALARVHRAFTRGDRLIVAFAAEAFEEGAHQLGKLTDAVFHVEHAERAFDARLDAITVDEASGEYVARFTEWDDERDDACGPAHTIRLYDALTLTLL